MQLSQIIAGTVPYSPAATVAAAPLQSRSMEVSTFRTPWWRSDTNSSPLAVEVSLLIIRRLHNLLPEIILVETLVARCGSGT